MFDQHGLIGTLVIGLIIGVIAKFLMPGRDPGGCIITIIIGLVGSFIGSLLGSMFFGSNYQAGWIVSVVGAMLLLFLYRMIMGRRGGGGSGPVV